MQVVSSVLHCMQARCLFRAFCAWLNKSKAKRAAMLRLMSDAAALRKSQLHRRWISWLEVTITNLAAKQRLMTAIAALSHGLLHRCWVSWLTFTQARLAAKANTMAAVFYWRSHTTSLSFRRWTAQVAIARGAALQGRELSHRISNVLKVSGVFTISLTCDTCNVPHCPKLWRD